jgi:acetoin utilization protein AcuB
MNRIPPIKAVMTPFPHSIQIEERLSHAREMMSSHGIRHLPVMDGGALAGVISERDLRHARHTRSEAEEPRVRDVCTLEPYIVELGEPLDAVLLRMASSHADAVLVVKGGRLAGIFTLSDACRSYGKLLRTLFPPGHDDDAA